MSRERYALTKTQHCGPTILLAYFDSYDEATDSQRHLEHCSEPCIHHVNPVFKVERV